MLLLKFCLPAIFMAGLAAARLLPTDNNPQPGTSDYYRMMEGELENLSPNSVSSGHLFQADMVLTDEQYINLMTRKATSNLASRWPENNGFPHVPYVFGDNNVDKAAVRNGIAHWEDHTCLTFTETSSTNQPHLEFILGSGCWSYIGKVFSRAQQISIGNGCQSLGIVVHEIGHAIGFYHEQSRSDRDTYIEVMYNNIIDANEGNYGRANTMNYNTIYDFLSDMHYSDRGFTSNGGPTIKTKNPLFQELMGQRIGLSHYDKLIANTMYSCIDKWLTACGLSSDPCQNHGYTDKNCNCVCRSGTSGTNCENIDEDYYASRLSGYSEIITSEGTVTTPNYPSSYPADFKMTKWIQAPECHTVKLTFNAFRIYGRNTYCNGQSCCYFEILDIRTDNLIDGEQFCSTDIAPGRVFESMTNEMVLYFISRTYWLPGWSADVTFVPVPGCDGEDTTTTTTDTTTTTTTTTTTATTTTTTTETTATTEDIEQPPVDDSDCSIDVISDTETQWTSPLFGEGNYYNDDTCSLAHDSDSPSWARVTFNSFALEAPSGSGECFDSVSFPKPYNLGTVTVCGDQSGEIVLPSSTFLGSFQTDDDTTDTGFDITITKETSECHLLIEADAVGDEGTIQTPRTNNKIWNKKACEWWIQSPEGTKVQLEFQSQKIGGCRKRKLLVNRAGDPTYPTDSTEEYCGRGVTFTATSDANKMSVFYYGSSRFSFSGTWSIIAA